MVELLIIRHGQSASNAQATLTGQHDYPLTDMGERQGELVSKYIYENYNVDAIYSSDLSRAANTVKVLSSLTGIETIKRENLREMHCGKWQGEKISDIKKQYGEYYERWVNQDLTACPPDGEGWQAVQARAVSAIMEIVKENQSKTVVVSTHGGVIKCLQGAFLNIPFSEWKEKLAYLDNAAFMKVAYDGEKFTLKGIFDGHLGAYKTAMPKGL